MKNNDILLYKEETYPAHTSSQVLLFTTIFFTSFSISLIYN